MKSSAAFFIRLVAVLLFVLPLAVAAEDGDASWAVKWLENAASAAHRLDYSGTFVYRYDDRVETSRYAHIADGQGEHVRLESLDGERREIIRNNNQVYCNIDGHRVRLEQRQQGREFPALLPEQLSLLGESYLIKPAGEARVAGYPVRIFLLQPKDNLRYAHRFYTDVASGLLLKSEVIDERGGIVEQYAFTDLVVGGGMDRSWISVDAAEQSSPKRHPVRSHEPQKEELPHMANHVPAGSKVVPVASGWRVDALPRGFKKITEVRRHMGKDGQVIQMVFSDGLANISLFIEKSDHDEDDQSGLFSQGIIQVYTKPVDDFLVTVVGEVPPQAVMQIADSVRFAGE